MAKDKKSKSTDQKARKLAKQSKKVAKGDKKSKTKSSKDVDSDADEDVDLDSVLAAYAEEQARFLKVTEHTCENPPSPRCSVTLAASPSNRDEILLFGGEFFDNTSVVFYNDLFVYLIDRGEWRRVTSPNSPLPRSGHAWCRGGNTGGVYLFGGEFSSPKQGTFYHYNDFWHLDTNTREWTRIETRSKGKGPSARSGHRMTFFKNYILLFGGFQDTSQQTRYLQDLWIYDCKDNVWHEIKYAAATQKPDARSSLSFLPHETGAVIYGGYSRVKTSVATSKHAKTDARRNILKPVIHQDTWFLRLTPPASEAANGTPPMARWERRKRAANAPNPTRAGATMAYHKGRGILFGGVHDVEESEEGIDSEFFQDLFVWNIDRNRFFPLTLRRPKSGAKKQNVGPRNRDRGKADEEELLRNLKALQTSGSIAGAADVEMQTVKEGDIGTAGEAKEFPVRYEMPHPRFDAQLAVQDDTLFIFSGTFERGDHEYTFNDMYSVDLGKLDRVREIFFKEPNNWNAKPPESDDEDEDEDEDMDMLDEDSEEGDDQSVETSSTAAPNAPSVISEAETLVETEVETEPSAREDARPYPRPFESLRDFYARTSEEWQRFILDRAVSADRDVKAIRKKAFEQAEERWWDCREEIRDLEDQQEAAGIGDVVSIADRTSEGGVGRRR